MRLLLVTCLTKDTKFVNLQVGNKVLISNQYKSSNIFACQTWMPTVVKQIFPSELSVQSCPIELSVQWQFSFATERSCDC